MTLASIASSFKALPVYAKSSSHQLRRPTRRPALQEPVTGNKVGPYSRKDKPVRTGKYPCVMRDGEKVFLHFDTDTDSWYRMTEVKGAIKYKRISAYHIEQWSGLTRQGHLNEKKCLDNENRRKGNYWPGVAEVGDAPF